jgi:HPt (histidine-containing phosphotransfer) domain-containing protein
LVRDKQPPEVIEKARKEVAARKEQKILPKKADDPEFVTVFKKEAENSLAKLEELISEESWYHREDDMRVYIIHIHTIKSSLANIGKLDLSAVALKLEQAARNKITEIVLSETPSFFRSLRAFLKELSKTDGRLDEQGKASVLNREITGINIKKGLEQMNNNEAAYMQTLRSYTDNVRFLLTSIQAIDEYNINEYKIAVHGIKGTSYYIFAEQVGRKAEALEKAARR